MNRPNHPAPQVEASLVPEQGWHCGHYYYRWNRQALSHEESGVRDQILAEFIQVLSPEHDAVPQRFQTFFVTGHKADFGLVTMDPNPLMCNSIHQKLLASRAGAFLTPVYSFISVSEVSEYLPTVEMYRKRLVDSGEQPESPAFQAKVAAYEKRLPMMLEHRLRPEFPDWPSMCFYPMNKSRNVGANWFLEAYSDRSAMMSEHAQSGMAFGGKVTQLVTASVGLDDWEWGVTLWAKNPQYLKDIVYQMRFDQASARYGEFGPFYTGYVMPAADILVQCGMRSSV